MRKAFPALRALSTPLPTTHGVPLGGFRLGDLLALAWFGRRSVLAATLMGLAAGAAVACAWPREFTVTARLLRADASDAAVAILGGDDIRRAVVDRVGAARIMAPFPMRAGHRQDAAASLLRNRLAARLDGSIITLAATHPDPPTALAIATAAISVDREERLADAASRADILQPQLAAAEAELAATATRAARIQQDAGVLDMTRSIEQGIERRDGEVRLRQAAVAAELASTRQALAGVPARVTGISEVTSRDAGEDARGQLLRLRLERAHMAPNYRPDYPGLIELEGKIATVRDALRAPPRVSEQVTRDIPNPDFVRLSAKVTRLTGEDRALAGERVELERQARATADRTNILRSVTADLPGLRQRQETQQAVVRRLASAVTDLRANAALSATDGGLRVIQAPVLGPPSRAPAWTILGRGALAGLLVGMLATLVTGRRRPVYLVAGEVERHLGLPTLARVALWRRGSAYEPAPAALRALALRLLEETDADGVRASKLHLVGTAANDGIDRFADRLAMELADRGARVLLLAPSSDSPALADETSDNLADTRGSYDLILVVSRYGMPAALARRLAGFADLDLLVVRAGHSRAQLVSRRCQSLAERPPLGFVFTDEVSPFARHA